MAYARQLALAEDESRVTKSLAGLVVVLLVVVFAVIVVRKLQVRCLLEACLASGQPACEETVARLRVSRLFERF